MESPIRTSLPAILTVSKDSATPPPPVHGSGSSRALGIKPSYPQRPHTERRLRTPSSDEHNSNGRHSENPTHSLRGHGDADSTISHRLQHHQHDITGLDGTGWKLPHKHKRSVSFDPRIRRSMSHTSSSGSRGLMPSWSGNKEKDRDADDNLLRPITQETSRSRYGSESTTGGFNAGSRKGSLLEAVEPNDRIGLVRYELHSMEDLEQVRKKRKQGEEYLRYALSSIGTLATDITRRLDYTYYNLLEKLTALTSTIASLRELSTSTSALFNDFERETTGLDQEIRKQIAEVKEFQPQIQKIESLEGRMRAGRQKADQLGNRLENMRGEIEAWERREADWQARVGQRLRIFWAVVACSVLVLLVAVTMQNRPTVQPPNPEAPSPQAPAKDPSNCFLRNSETRGPNLDSGGQGDRFVHPSGLAYRQATCQGSNPRSTERQRASVPTSQDPLRILDEL